MSVIQNCERFKIPLYIVRSKSDIRDKNNNDSDVDVDDFQTQARQPLSDSTKKQHGNKSDERSSAGEARRFHSSQTR